MRAELKSRIRILPLLVEGQHVHSKRFGESWLSLRMLVLSVHLAAFASKALVVLSLRFINDDLATTI